MNLSTDAYNARLVEVAKRFFADIRDISSDILFAEFRIASHALELFDMNRSEVVILDDPFGDQNRILEVVTTPGHKGDADVTTERHLTPIRRRAIRDHLTLLDPVSRTHNRPLGDTCILIRPPILDQIDDVHIGLGSVLSVRLQNNSGCVHTLNDAVALRHDRHPRISSHHGFHPGADQRSLGPQQRNRLPHHVRTHQSPIRIIVLKKRNQRCRNGHQLVRRHIHHVDLCRRDHLEFALLSSRDPIEFETSGLIQASVGLRDRHALLIQGGQECDVPGDLAFLNTTVRRLNEAHVVHSSKG